MAGRCLKSGGLRIFLESGAPVFYHFAMKNLRVLRYVLGGALLLTGLFFSVRFLAASGRGTSLSTILLLIGSGAFLVSFGRRAVRNVLGAVLLAMAMGSVSGERLQGAARRE